jgi:hypothetical protein
MSLAILESRSIQKSNLNKSIPTGSNWKILQLEFLDTAKVSSQKDLSLLSLLLFLL